MRGRIRGSGWSEKFLLLTLLTHAVAFDEDGRKNAAAERGAVSGGSVCTGRDPVEENFGDEPGVFGGIESDGGKSRIDDAAERIVVESDDRNILRNAQFVFEEDLVAACREGVALEEPRLGAFGTGGEEIVEHIFDDAFLLGIGVEDPLFAEREAMPPDGIAESGLPAEFFRDVVQRPFEPDADVTDPADAAFDQIIDGHACTVEFVKFHMIDRQGSGCTEAHDVR